MILIFLATVRAIRIVPVVLLWGAMNAYAYFGTINTHANVCIQSASASATAAAAGV